MIVRSLILFVSIWLGSFLVVGLVPGRAQAQQDPAVPQVLLYRFGCDQRDGSNARESCSSDKL